ncbi:Aspartyl protease AED3 [Vitis vinifera]|uniref:Aspartyl protease AED3 n=1 Tax=Vitis vinifera TaxID=29760 RepID=A0A438G0C6_VITVI|nr:Aspartyl protease AED3 [Vitis vinifera]
MDIFTAFVFLTLVVSTTKAFDPCASPSSESKGSDLSVIHVYGQCSPFNQHKAGSWVNTVINMASKDPARVTYLSSLVASPKATSVPIASGQQVLNIGNYVVRVKLGTPGQLMFMVLDTSRDAAWVPCADCAGCSSPTFSPNTSSTYASLQCSVPQCTQLLFRLRQRCLRLDPSAAGAPGAGSWAHVVALTIRVSILWCLLLLFPSFKSYYFSGSLRLGPLGQPKNIRTTPLLRNPHRPTLYYVNLTGVSVGRVLVPVAPELLAFDPNTGAGTIIDSGTVITRFVEPVYAAIRDEFRKQVKGPFATIGAFDTCFAATNEDIAPPVTFHFTGMDLKLPLENTLIHSSAGSLACLAMAAAPNNVNSVLNVIANLQQQNLRIMFDVTNSRLGIARELCN